MPNNEMLPVQSKETRNKELLEMRTLMQQIIIKAIDPNDRTMGFVEKSDAITFLYQYRDYLLETGQVLPTYLFGEYNQDFFEECVQMQMSGGTLLKVNARYQYLLNTKCSIK